MKLILRNLISTIRRFKLASLLNVTGLTIAFTAFIVIMTQVNYDINFDKFHPKGDRTYRIEYSLDSLSYSSNLSRPSGETIIKLSPSIEMGSIYAETTISFYLPGEDKDKLIKENFGLISPDFINMVDFQFIEGNANELNNIQNIIICETVAKKLFPGEKAKGKELHYKDGNDLDVLTIVGVFRDFPENSMFAETQIYKNIGDYFINVNNEWSFTYFMTLNQTDAKENVEKLLASFAKEKFSNYERFFIRLNPITNLHFSNDMEYNQVPVSDKTTVTALFSVAILILLIAIINFINFSMALTPLRIRSINIQKILGSTVFSLRLAQIIEAVFFTIISFLLSLLVVKYLSTTTFTTFLTATLNVDQISPLIIIIAAVAVITGIFAGLLPALYSTSFKPAMVIKGSFGNSVKGRQFRTILVGFQFLSSIVLFCVALFMIIQNRYMLNHPVGFNRENIVCAFTSNTVSKSNDALKAKLMTNTLIKDVAFSSGPLISNGKMGWGRNFKGKLINFDCYPVSADFIRFMEMEIIEGRDFRDDDMLKPSGSFIFNEKGAKELEIKVGDGFNGHLDTVSTVIGVVKNFNFQPMQYGIKPIALYVFGKDPWWGLSYVNIRIANENMPQAIDFIRKTIKEFDPKLSNVKVTFMDDFVGGLYKKEQNQAKLISIFAFMAMAISLIGVFGLVVFETQHKRKEIGLRKINGATVMTILKMFNRKFVKIVMVCFVISCPISWYATNLWLEEFAYRTPIHWWVFALALITVLFITILTVTIQSYKAASENPVKSLKSE